MGDGTFSPAKKRRRRWQDQKRQGYQNHADDRRKRYAVVGVHAFGESVGCQCLGELGGYSRDEGEAETNALQQGGGTKSNARSAGSSTSGDSLRAMSITTISSKGLYNSDVYLQFSRGFKTASNVFSSVSLLRFLYHELMNCCDLSVRSARPYGVTTMPSFLLPTRQADFSVGPLRMPSLGEDLLARQCRRPD